MVYKEEGERVLETELITVGKLAVESAGGKVKHAGVFVKVLRDSQRFGGVDWRSRDKIDKVEFRCILIPRRQIWYGGS